MPRGRQPLLAHLLTVGLLAPVIFGTFLVASALPWALVGWLGTLIFGGESTWVYYAWAIGDAAIALPVTAYWVKREGLTGPRAQAISTAIWLWAILPIAAGYTILAANPGQ